MANKRIHVVPKDIATAFDISLETAQKRLRNVRQELGKKARSFVTITQFCESEVLDVDEFCKAAGLEVPQ